MANEKEIVVGEEKEKQDIISLLRESKSIPFKNDNVYEMVCQPNEWAILHPRTEISIARSPRWVASQETGACKRIDIRRCDWAKNMLSVQKMIGVMFESIANCEKQLSYH